MFGSEVVATLVYQRMSALTAVTDVVGTRMRSIDIVPEGVALPALLFHPSTSRYGGPISGKSGEESLDYQIRFICEGKGTGPIWAAAEAQLADLDGNHFDITVNDEHYTVSFTSRGESIPTTVYESGTYYRILGTSYEVHVTKG